MKVSSCNTLLTGFMVRHGKRQKCFKVYPSLADALYWSRATCRIGGNVGEVVPVSIVTREQQEVSK